VIDEFHPSVGSHPLMMEGFVMCSLKKSINNNFFIIYQIGFFFARLLSLQCFSSLLKRVVIEP